MPKRLVQQHDQARGARDRAIIDGDDRSLGMARGAAGLVMTRPLDATRPASMRRVASVRDAIPSFDNARAAARARCPVGISSPPQDPTRITAAGGSPPILRRIVPVENEYRHPTQTPEPSDRPCHGQNAVLLRRRT